MTDTHTAGATAHTEQQLNATGTLEHLAPRELECRVLEPDDWCGECGRQGAPSDTVTRRPAWSARSSRGLAAIVLSRSFERPAPAHRGAAISTAADRQGRRAGTFGQGRSHGVRNGAPR
jgi:hypothetical protein